MGKKLSAKDSWPKHTNKSVMDLYVLAKARDWQLVEETNHKVVRLYCPGDDCSFRIFSTGRNQETKVKQLRKQILNCGHNSKINDILVEIKEKLIQIERLVTAAELKVELEKAELSFDRLSVEDDLEVIVVEIESLEERLAELDHAGGVRELITSADDGVSKVRTMLKPFTEDTPGITQYKNMLKKLKERINEVRI